MTRVGGGRVCGGGECCCVGVLPGKQRQERSEFAFCASSITHRQRARCSLSISEPRTELVAPRAARPKTTTAVARRLIGQALGVSAAVSGWAAGCWGGGSPLLRAYCVLRASQVPRSNHCGSTHPTPPTPTPQVRDKKAEAELAALRREKREERRMRQEGQAAVWGDDADNAE